MLRTAGYEAAGVDPEAPQRPGYSRVEFERYDMPQPADAIVACTSLHHVADLGAVLDLIDAALVPGGLLVVVEWARERFDEATARWCFDRLPRPAPILAGSTGGMRNGATPASRGTPTAVPGRQPKACIRARTSFASLVPGSTPGHRIRALLLPRPCPDQRNRRAVGHRRPADPGRPHPVLRPAAARPWRPSTTGLIHPGRPHPLSAPAADRARGASPAECAWLEPLQASTLAGVSLSAWWRRMSGTSSLPMPWPSKSTAMVSRETGVGQGFHGDVDDGADGVRRCPHAPGPGRVDAGDLGGDERDGPANPPGGQALRARLRGPGWSR